MLKTAADPSIQGDFADIDPQFRSLVDALRNVAYHVPSRDEHVPVAELIAKPALLDDARRFMRQKGQECIDEADRRIVRLYITDQGRAVITYYVTQAAPQWRKAFDFADEADEAVVRRFFVQMIGHLGRLIREERGR